MGVDAGEIRGLPRTRRAWAEAIRDAARFGERVDAPSLDGREILHRIATLAVVAVLTAIAAGIMSLPTVGAVSRSVNAVTSLFDVQVGPARLPRIAQRSVVVDRDGKVLATLAGEENRVIVSLGQIPKIAQQAVIAIEDANFYEHDGIDTQGLLRALVTNLRSGDVAQGGSTITQQLIKNTLVGNEQSLDRKIREARLAVKLEEKMDKSRILELYLNETYFGEGAYGIATAAEFYLGKPVERLNLSDAAMLAGLIASPENFEPLNHPDEALARRNLVLQRMVAERFVTQQRADAAAAKPLKVARHELPGGNSPYFVEYVKQQILNDKRFGKTADARAKALFQAGLRIETTLDLDLQRVATRANAAVLDEEGDPASALVSIDPATGGVVAMVGGRDFDESKFNLAVQGRRQPGSIFKPLTLLAALEQGVAPTLELPAPSPYKTVDTEGKPYKVRNYDGNSYGTISLRTATELSVNTYYVQLLQKIGPAAVVDMGERLGITTPLQPIVSLALGTIAVSPLEMASAYATIANKGVRCAPFAITRVTDGDGNVVLENEPACERTVEADVAALGADVLRGVIERGTGATNGDIGRPAAGKTGTTDEYTDSWFAGFTPQFATVVWLGFPESTERSLYDIHGLPRVFGGSLPAMIWARYMRAAHEDLPVVAFPKPPKIAGSNVPDVVGMLYRDARAALREAGFEVTFVKAPSGEPAFTVLSQTPEAGSEASPGIVVTLEVSDGSGEAEKPANGPPSPSPSPSP